MLHLIPRPLHRVLLRRAHAVRIRWWRWRGAQICGVRVLARDAAGQVLLLRHSYGSGSWMLPGGGYARGETPLSAAARELHEETGCTLHGGVIAAIYDEALHGAVNRVHLIAGQASGTPRADGREIIEARFFAMDALPQPLAYDPVVQLGRWIAAAEAAVRPSDPA